MCRDYLNVMLSVVMLNVVMLSVVVLNVVMLSVVAPSTVAVLGYLRPWGSNRDTLDKPG
jgi:hypothetical protein